MSPGCLGTPNLAMKQLCMTPMTGNEKASGVLGSGVLMGWRYLWATLRALS